MPERGGEVAYYAAPGAMTDLASCPDELLVGLPTDPVALCRVVQGVMVHDEWAPWLGVDVDQPRREHDIQARSAVEMVEAIQSVEPGPLIEPRRLDKRIYGTCRHFSTLSCALLRRQGTPARILGGYATYFERDASIDHWITEFWSDEQGEWVRIDVQLDPDLRKMLDFDRAEHELGADDFVLSWQVWQRCRAGEADPDAFGIAGMSGSWFIRNGIVRELAALNKVELLPWDGWGMIMPGPRDQSGDIDQLADLAAATMESGGLEAIQRLYRDDDRLRVPEVVTDLRFQRTYTLP